MLLNGLLVRPDVPTATPPTRRSLVVVGVISVLAAAAFLLAPPMGIDLAAQTAHGDFWARHGAAVLDFGWYGGVSQFGYSLLTPAPMAWLGSGAGGARALGAIAAVIASLLLTLLLLRTRAARSVLAGTLGAFGIFGNIVSGRVTFTAGLAFGLAALLALTLDKPWPRRAGAVAGALLTGAASPVAGLFLGLAGTALLLTGGKPGRRLDGLLLAAGAGVSTVGLSLLFGTGGPMNTIESDTLRSCTVSLLVAVLVPRRAVRIGALLSAAGVLAAAMLTTPVGLNAGRLSATFALATLAGYAAVPSWSALTRPPARNASIAGLLVLVALWQHPMAVSDLRSVTDPTSSPAYFQPLLDELARRQPLGRVEVVPTRDYWEAAYVPGTAPLARGWLRQADSERNAVFFDGRFSASGYQQWLTDNGVSLVALADAPASSVSRNEARLVRRNPAFLHKVWRGGHWTLYEVAGAPAIVTGARLVSSTDSGIVVDVAAPGDVLVRVRWSRWLAVRGPAGCIAETSTGWTRLSVREAGRYEVTGSLSTGPVC
jgi:hypothetical protein